MGVVKKAMKKVVKTLPSAVAWAMLAAGMSGCAILHARSRTAGPPLDMPVPPARVVPIESQPIVAAEPPTVDDVPTQTPPTLDKTPTPTPARVDREPAPPARQQAPADTGAATAPPPAPPQPPPVLQTTANPTEAEQRTRTALEYAKRDLGRIDLKRLNGEAQRQYQIAQRFVQQAEDALRARNAVFAEQLADKAQTLAAALQKQ
jgi:hypothetical protein